MGALQSYDKAAVNRVFKNCKKNIPSGFLLATRSLRRSSIEKTAVYEFGYEAGVDTDKSPKHTLSYDGNLQRVPEALSDVDMKK